MVANQDFKPQQSNSEMLISYNLLRKTIGCLAFFLPIVLGIGGIFYAGCDFIENSISDYYHTEMRNILVGTLCAVAMFMFAYRGPDKYHTYAGNIACFSAVCVAFFPTSVDDVSSCSTDCIAYAGWIGITHLIAALIFFGVLIYFSLKLFPAKNDKTEHASHQSHLRDRIYLISGYVMIACVALIILYFLIDEKYPGLEKYKPVFILELIALWAFGISWLTKGQFFFKDKKQH
ncbi:DUF998 domain-containing protein [Algibacter sp. 2305UL17-15]|uniref:DUF998 domain-containing protein n=1 Tax=Algibacter sp. 2305UL17-15 TaxID=3231268 RepID=UPI003457C759